MRARYLLVDVFTDRPLGGNALAVFPDGRSVTDDLMQPIARELNLSETAFVLAAAHDGYEVRIFTPAEELPFAGHPTLGTAWVLRHLGVIRGADVVQRSPAGETLVRFAGDQVWMERTGSVGAPIEDPERIARALGVAVAEIGCTIGGVALKPAVADAGVAQLMVPLSDRDALAALAPRPEIGALAHDGVYSFTPDGEEAVRARFFAPGIGVVEDPATGSAAAALGLFVGRRVGDRLFEISQGEEVGRPSRLVVEAACDRVRVGGSVVLVGEGELTC